MALGRPSLRAGSKFGAHGFGFATAKGAEKNMEANLKVLVRVLGLGLGVVGFRFKIASLHWLRFPNVVLVAYVRF